MSAATTIILEALDARRQALLAEAAARLSSAVVPAARHRQRLALIGEAVRACDEQMREIELEEKLDAAS